MSMRPAVVVNGYDLVIASFQPRLRGVFLLTLITNFEIAKRALECNGPSKAGNLSKPYLF
jgi:hypothetical protein